jgi:5-methylcytosine-specific restriction endonuclease McrA
MMVHGFVSDKEIKKERNKAKELRKSQWWKQKLGLGLCYYCEQKFAKKDLTMDHKTPLSRGGKTTKGNVVVACKPCNNEKKYFTPAEMVLIDEDQGR